MIKVFPILISFTLLTCASGQAQEQKKKIFQAIEGYWEGGFVKNNSFQQLDMRFYGDDENIQSLQVMEEWHPQYGEFVIPVSIDSLGQIILNTGYGT